MSILLESLQKAGYEPVGTTHNGDPNVPLKPPVGGIMALEIYIVDSNNQLPDGRFGTPRPLDRRGVYDLLIMPGSLRKYFSRIRSVDNHPQGWAGHEQILSGSFSGEEAEEFKNAALAFNERRRLQRR